MKRVMCLLALLALPFAASAAGAPPSSSRLAPVLAAKDWINGRVTASDLDGKVVVVDIFTFNCINCKHVLPNLQHLHAALPAGDLAIIGVHAPETAEERDRSNVVRELARQGVVWPVAVDENFTIWHALATNIGRHNISSTATVCSGAPSSAKVRTSSSTRRSRRSSPSTDPASALRAPTAETLPFFRV